jgi:hypothetical protein
MFQKGNKLAVGKGRPKGNTFNDSIRKAIEKCAKDKKQSVGEYLWNLAESDSKLRAKLVDKIISDAPKDLNIKGDVDIIIRKPEGVISEDDI